MIACRRGHHVSAMTRSRVSARQESVERAANLERVRGLDRFQLQCARRAGARVTATASGERGGRKGRSRRCAAHDVEQASALIESSSAPAVGSTCGARMSGSCLHESTTRQDTADAQSARLAHEVGMDVRHETQRGQVAQLGIRRQSAEHIEGLRFGRRRGRAGSATGDPLAPVRWPRPASSRRARRHQPPWRRSRSSSGTGGRRRRRES